MVGRVRTHLSKRVALGHIVPGVVVWPSRVGASHRVIIALYKPYKKNTFPPWTELSKKKGMTI